MELPLHSSTSRLLQQTRPPGCSWGTTAHKASLVSTMAAARGVAALCG